MNSKLILILFISIGIHLVSSKPHDHGSAPAESPTTPAAAPAAPAVEEMPTPQSVAPEAAPAEVTAATEAPAPTEGPTTAAPTTIGRKREVATDAPVTAAPTDAPTEAATDAPTAAPTAAPAADPIVAEAAAMEPRSAAPVEVTVAPTAEPTAAPTAAPTEAPAAVPAAPALDVMQGDQPAAAEGTETEQPIDCDAKLLEMDNCARQGMLMARPVIYNSAEQVEEQFCANVTEHIRCMRDYKQCLSSFPRQVYSIVLFNIKKVTRNVCENNESRSELVEKLACFKDKGAERIVIADISDMLTRNLDYIATLEGDAMIQNLCCGYQAMDKEAHRILNEECADNSTTVYWSNISKSLLADASDLLCGGYANHDTCVEKAPAVMEFWAEKVKIVKVNGILTVNALANTSTVSEAQAARPSYTALTPAVKIIKKLNAQMTNEVDNGKKNTE